MSWDTPHFLYPQWLWAIIPVVLLSLWWWQRGGSSSAKHDWARHVDAHLLKHLSVSDAQSKNSFWFSLMTFLAALATVIALAGPAWKQEKVPTFSEDTASVIVLSLAQSMNSDDIKPSRLKRAEHKIRDILARTQGDERGLVIYSDIAFVASPLTNDAKIIEQMLPELSTNLMPVLGNQLSSAIDSAIGMLKRGKVQSGRIIVLTDSAGDDMSSSEAAVRRAKKAGYQLSIIAVGTKEGALLQTVDGDTIPNAQGQAVTVTLPIDKLTQLANIGGGVMRVITADDNDIDSIFALDSGAKKKGKEQSVKADKWQNQGYWLLFSPLLVLPLYFQRGLMCVTVLTMVSFTLSPDVALAADSKDVRSKLVKSSVWDSFWYTANQRGQNSFNEGNYDQAAKKFENKEWQASSNFKSGDYKSAAQQFDKLGNYYNKGNALAQTGQLELAANAYKEALKKNPDDKDAKKALDIVNKILEEQKQKEQQKDKQDQSKQDQSKQDQSKQDQSKQDQSKQDQSKQDQSKQDQSKQDQSKQDQSKQDQSKQDQSKQDQSKQDQSKQDQSKQDQSKQDQSKQDQSKQDQSKRGSENKDDKDTKKGIEQLLDWENNAQKEQTEDKSKDKKRGHAQRPLDQAVEQQLRRVPDDPSGLLRARIYQHYYRQQQMGQ